MHNNQSKGYQMLGKAMGKLSKVKKSGSFQGKSNKLGGGGRFKQLTAQGVSPAMAAYIGQKKYGKKKMASMATKGKKK